MVLLSIIYWMASVIGMKLGGLAGNFGGQKRVPWLPVGDPHQSQLVTLAVTVW